MPGADLALLLDAARAAGDVVLSFAGPNAQRWDKPGGAGPVTEADLAANACLREHLRPARPDYGWLSEEDADDSDRLERDRVFVIDPIDGTRSFIEGSRTWAISIAVVEDGQPVAGVVALPARGLVFAAERDGGAFLNEAPLTPSDRTALHGADMLIPKPALKADYWPGGVPDVTRHHRPSLAYRLCLAASGRFDAMLTLRDAWEWDIAAGSLIAQEAGCVVTDRDGARLAFNVAHAKTPGVLVANADLHGQLAARLTTTP
ncbi:inositol monophosphatase family protein [Primorskyibacter sp. S187A]|uniref:inositol monophosphatase family protein n=1 Tax=Primorskyibacter sp. S187A TaxID=3415130 RepID=UPI003C7BEAB8